MIKRIIDLLVSTSSLFLLAPIFALLALLVRFNLGAPVLFKQVRPGRFGEPFEMIKFRTMQNTTDENGQLLCDAKRITPFGNFLRNSSLDELPELWNVFKGEMSLVGPRPLLMEYLPLYSPEQFRRHDIRPGITGWAQVRGRNAISWEEKFGYDVWYVENQSTVLDMKIILMTIKKVFSREGITAVGETTMPGFTGNKEE